MKAHICIGGPLDGEYATHGDFYGSYEKIPGTKRNDYSKRVQGMYEHLKHEYWDYNTSHKARGGASVIWLHNSLNKPSISARKR